MGNDVDENTTYSCFGINKNINFYGSIKDKIVVNYYEFIS